MTNLTGVNNLTGEANLVDDNASDASFTELIRHRLPPTASNGAVGRNSPTFTDVALQRGATWTLLDGLQESDPTAIGAAVGAMNYGFAHQNADGSFQYTQSDPTQIPSDAVFFLQAFGRIYDGVQNSSFSDTYSSQLAGALPALSNAMAWLSLQTTALNHYDATSVNRLLFDGAAFILNGQILNNQSYIQTGNNFVNQALALQQSNGALTEYGGYDSSYQATSMLEMEVLITYSYDPVQVAQLTSALASAVSWEETRIQPNGYVDVAGNTRTGLGQEISPSGLPKEVNYSEVSLSLYYASTILNSSDARAAADSVTNYANAHSGIIGLPTPSESRTNITPSVSSSTAQGGADADSITATANNQRLVGGGDDIFYIGRYTGVTVTVPTGSTGITTVATLATNYTLAPNVNNLSLQGNFAHVATGNGLDNVISASTGNDTIFGGGGNVTMRVGTGADTMTGQGAYDVFIFPVTSDHNNVITDFKPGYDVIDLRAMFTQGGFDPTKYSNYLQIKQQGPNTVLSIDPDGTGGGAAHTLVTLFNVVATTLTAGTDYLY